ncbi:hypothetical protein E3V08_01320 [Candidatus Atribacteria bacterium MT.SAG.1]|nr:hypothetical protein E3V08_01320 [Candidatus Atribacteria bacterium MT.SAG.1]
MAIIKIQDVIEIPNCGLYAKTPQALKSLSDDLEKKGYKIEDCSKDKNRLAREVQEKKGWHLWYVSLKDDVYQRRGKCDSCGSYIDVRGIQSHKHKCEKCGEYTYLEYVDGSIVRFKFLLDDNEQRTFEPTLRMKVFNYDDKLHCLLLYPGLENGNSLILQTWQRNKDKWQEVEKDGKRFIAIRYNPYSAYIENDAVISIYEVCGHQYNHKVVKLYDGKEYGDFNSLPIPESYIIYETWHWAPLKPSPTLHERIIIAAGMVSDCGYYYQDGRSAFSNVHLERMHLFVKHFTTLDIKKWDKMIVGAPKSGPGMIKTVASFCDDHPKIKNRPNIGNLLVGLSKVCSGRNLTEAEKTSMVNALKDPKESKLFFDTFGYPK